MLVTVTYNALRDGVLEPFLDCVRAQRSQDFLLLIVDNASSDGTADFLKTLDMPNTRVILNDRNTGFASACNQGIAFARDQGAGRITFINNDTEFGPDLIKGMEESLDASGAAALSPLVTLHANPDLVWFATGSLSRWRAMVPVHDHLGRPRSVLPAQRLLPTAFASGCCLIVRMDAFNVVPGFDERFFVYWEDVDLCRTLGAKGLRVVVDTALECQHKVSVSTGGASSDFSVANFTRGHVLFVRKHFGAPALAYMLPFSAFKVAVRLVTGKFKWRQVPVWWRGVTSGLAA